MVNKKLVNVGAPVNETDATNKGYIDSRFTQINMTHNVFRHGITMQGARIEGLGSPVSLTDGTNKQYVDTKDQEVKKLC